RGTKEPVEAVSRGTYQANKDVDRKGLEAFKATSQATVHSRSYKEALQCKRPCDEQTEQVSELVYKAK
ncbi:hypothetical protein Ancab_001409, partial [Ancistrocladus abbreviatus]